jgi:hypothetical protein
VTPTTVMPGRLTLVGLATTAALAPPSARWRAAAEHSRAFRVTGIVGFAALGFAGSATAGLRWMPAAWFAFWATVGTRQPSVVADVVGTRRFGRRHRARAQAPSPPVAAPPLIRWQAPVSPAVPPGPGIVTGP